MPPSSLGVRDLIKERLFVGEKVWGILLIRALLVASISRVFASSKTFLGPLPSSSGIFVVCFCLSSLLKFAMDCAILISYSSKTWSLLFLAVWVGVRHAYCCVCGINCPRFLRLWHLFSFDSSRICGSKALPLGLPALSGLSNGFILVWVVGTARNCCYYSSLPFYVAGALITSIVCVLLPIATLFELFGLCFFE